MVKIRGSVLEFRKIFDRGEGSLRSEFLSYVDAAKSRRLDTEARELRTIVRIEMKRGIGMAVHMTVKAAHSTARRHRLPVISCIELLLRDFLDQQADAVKLHRREHAVK